MSTTANYHQRGKKFLLFFLLLFTSGCASSSDTWEKIERSGVLGIGLDPTYPPFEVTDETGVIGLDVDLVNAISEELGVRSEFVHFGYDGLYDALATKQVDVLISALVIVPGRKRDFAYSEPYFNAGEILVVAAENDEISAMEDLGGRLLAVELGAQGHVEGLKWAKRLAGLDIRSYGSADEALSSVVAGQTDAALVDNISGRLYLSQQEENQRLLQLLSPPVTVEPYALVVRIEDETLLKKINEALNSLESSGELDQILQLWLGR